MKFALMKQKIAPWLGAVFCAALSLITIVSNLVLTVVNGGDTGGWAIVFLSFLPMCFYFAAIGTSHMQREIRDLKAQLAQLEAKYGAP
jgi:hypothetical protein